MHMLSRRIVRLPLDLALLGSLNTSILPVPNQKSTLQQQRVILKLGI